MEESVKLKSKTLIEPRFWVSSFRQISNKNQSPLVWGIIRAWSTNSESKSRRPYTNQAVTTNCDNTQDRLRYTKWGIRGWDIEQQALQPLLYTHA